MTTLGILGGGHLAKMLAQAADVLAIETEIFAQGDLFLKQFAEHCDVITLMGSVAPDMVEKIEQFGGKVYPTSKTLAQVQDRVLQLRTMQAAGISVPRFRPVQTATDVMAAVEEFGFPLLLKTRYGGAASETLRRSAEVPDALERLKGQELYAEAQVLFVRELAITVARGRGGEFQFYPVVEVVRHGRLYQIVRCPAPIEEATAFLATEIAKLALEAVDGVGVFGIELFELENGELTFHKLVPYPHEAGLYTIEGTITSQFANHLRAIMGLTLGDVYQIAPAAVTLALQADRATSFSLESVRDALATGGTQFHLYHSGELAAGTLAGHVTILGYNTDGAEKVGLLALSRIRW